MLPKRDTKIEYTTTEVLLDRDFMVSKFAKFFWRNKEPDTAVMQINKGSRSYSFQLVLKQKIARVLFPDLLYFCVPSFIAAILRI